MIKGLDTGYKYTKDNDFNIFKSCYSEVNTSVTGAHKIEVNGNTYYVGIGDGTADVNKIASKLTELCVLTSLCLPQESVYNLVVGLPIKQFNDYKDKFKETILSYNSDEVIYMDKQRSIMIKDVLVFPQGAAAYFSMQQQDSDYIIVDIG